MAKSKKQDPAPTDEGDGEPDAPQLPKRLIRGGTAKLVRAVYNSNEKRRHLGNVSPERLLYIVTNGEEGSATNKDGTTADDAKVHGILFFFDCTPEDQKGKKFTGNDPSWKRDPQPSAGGLSDEHEGDHVEQFKGQQGAIAPMRLCAPSARIIHAEIDPAQYAPPDAPNPDEVSADLNREYQNFGCTPVINAEAGPRQGAVIPIEGFHGPDYGDGEGFALIPVEFRYKGKVYPVTQLRVGRGA